MYSKVVLFCTSLAAPTALSKRILRIKSNFLNTIRIRFALPVRKNTELVDRPVDGLENLYTSEYILIYYKYKY